MYSNMNFPAPLAALGFLGGAAGLLLAALVILAAAAMGKTTVARVVTRVAGLCALGYFALLLGFSLASRDMVLAHGQEKYFCEMDCHLAYSVVDVRTATEGSLTRYTVTLRTRFDETTISSARPKDAPLTPAERTIRLQDDQGHEYGVAAEQGTPLMTPLRPGDFYDSQLDFLLPKNSSGLRLLVQTRVAWPDHVVIGDESSWLHKKTYFRL